MLQPAEGQILELVPKADFPFEIIRVNRKCGGVSGSTMTVRLEIDGDIVDMDDTDTAGDMPVTDAALDESEPDGSHYIVPEGGTLYAYLENIVSDLADFVLQVSCRRTEVNVLVTE